MTAVDVLASGKVGREEWIDLFDNDALEYVDVPPRPTTDEEFAELPILDLSEFDETFPGDPNPLVSLDDLQPEGDA